MPVEKEPKFERPEKSAAELRDEEERKSLEGKGWVLVSEGAQKVTDKRSEDDILDEYREKHKDDDFWQTITVPKHEIRDGELMTMWGKECYVFMRTKEEAEKEKERQKGIRKELVKNLREPLQNIGFKKDKKDTSTWQRQLKDVIQVFNLQTSWCSHEYFVNLGIFFRKKDKKMEAPKELDCHYRERLNSFLPKKELKDYYNAFDFDDVPNEFEGEAPELKKIEKAREYLEKYAIPFFETAKTEQGLKEFEEKIEKMEEEKEEK